MVHAYVLRAWRRAFGLGGMLRVGSVHYTIRLVEHSANFVTLGGGGVGA